MSGGSRVDLKVASPVSRATGAGPRVAAAARRWRGILIGRPDLAGETTGAPGRGWRFLAQGAMRRAPALHLGLVFLFVIVACGVVVPLVTPYAPDQLLPGARLQPPSLLHPFGTDSLGRDLLTRVAYGSHLAARIAFMSVSISLAIGLVLGSLAGYYRGWTDQLLSRTMDGWLSLPGALVAIVIVARLGASLDNLILALGVMGVPAFYRMVRNTTLSCRHMPFAEAALALGATDRRIMWRHVFPNILSPLIVLVTMKLGTVLLTGSSLSFIGLGAQPPAPEWGSLLATGKNYLDSAWWLAVFPGLAVTFTVVGLNLFGDGLRDLLDPRQNEMAGSQGEGISSAQLRRPRLASSPACPVVPRLGAPERLPVEAAVVVGSEDR